MQTIDVLPESVHDIEIDESSTPFDPVSAAGVSYARRQQADEEWLRMCASSHCQRAMRRNAVIFTPLIIISSIVFLTAILNESGLLVATGIAGIGAGIAPLATMWFTKRHTSSTI